MLTVMQYDSYQCSVLIKKRVLEVTIYLQLVRNDYSNENSSNFTPLFVNYCVPQQNAQDDAEDMISKIIENSFNIRCSFGRSIMVTKTVKGLAKKKTLFRISSK